MRGGGYKSYSTTNTCSTPRIILKNGTDISYIPINNNSKTGVRPINSYIGVYSSYTYMGNPYTVTTGTTYQTRPETYGYTCKTRASTYAANYYTETYTYNAEKLSSTTYGHWKTYYTSRQSQTTKNQTTTVRTNGQQPSSTLSLRTVYCSTYNANFTDISYYSRDSGVSTWYNTAKGTRTTSTYYFTRSSEYDYTWVTRSSTSSTLYGTQQVHDILTSSSWG